MTHAHAQISDSEAKNQKRRRTLHEYKTKIHQDVINQVDLEVLIQFDTDTGRREIAKLVWELVNQNNFPLNAAEKDQITEEVVNETFGLGPLEPLLQDPTVDDILINDYKTVYVERSGKLSPVAGVTFKDNQHLRHIINRIVARVGRRIDESSPMVDARLADGSRVNAIIPPLAVHGPVLCIRRFKEIPLTAQNLISLGTISKEMLFLIEIAVRTRMNILISGGTGSGKTTLLNVLSSFIPNDERVITIEDAAELKLQQPHVISLETRPENMEGRGRVSQRELVINSLRMRPDRIIVGEVRGAEALDMLQAMNTGHDGSLTTVHSNSPRDGISRLETMVLMSNANMSPIVINRQIASALNIIVHIRRYSDGVRRVEAIEEIVGMEGTVISMHEIASFVQTGTSTEGACQGEFKIHPVKPRFLQKAQAAGLLRDAAQNNPMTSLLMEKR